MELDEFHLSLLLICQQGVIVKISVADNIRSDFLCKVRLASTRSASENQIFRFNQHRGERIPVSFELLNQFLLGSGFCLLDNSFFFIFFSVCQYKLVSRFTEPLQAFLNETNCGEDIPTVNDELTAVVITVGHVFYGLAVLFVFIDTCKDTANHLTVRVVFAYRKTLLILNRQRCNLLFKNLAGDARQGLIGISSLTLAVGALDHLASCLFEGDIKGLIVVTKADIIHREPLVCRYHTFGGDGQFELFLLLCLNSKVLAFQKAFCFYGIKAVRRNICSVCQIVSNSHYIFRWIPLSVIGYKFVFCALIMKRDTILIDVF